MKVYLSTTILTAGLVGPTMGRLGDTGPGDPSKSEPTLPSVTSSSDLLVSSWSLGDGKTTNYLSFDYNPVKAKEDELNFEPFLFDSCHDGPHPRSGLAPCFSDYFCSYMNPRECEVSGGNVSYKESCYEAGFGRFIEFQATGDEYQNTPELQVCIRDARDQPLDLGEVSEDYCRNMTAYSVGSFGEICVASDIDTGSFSGDCASGRLSHHVRLLGPHGEQSVDACLKLISDSSREDNSALTSSPSPCGIKPPVQCDDACQMANLERKAALGIIGAIPKVGGVVKAILGFLVPEQGLTIDQVILQMVDYVNARIAQAQSKTLLDGVEAKLESIDELGNMLQSLINTNTTSPQAIRERTSRFNDILQSCTNIRKLFHRDDFEPIQLIPYISKVGQACISFHVSQVYHYEEVTGAQTPSGYGPKFRASLDAAVNDFIALSNATTSAVLQWRESTISSKVWDGKYGCNLSSNWHYAQVADSSCPAVYGLNTQKQHRAGYAKGCHHYSAKSNTEPLYTFYKDVTMRVFEDSFVRALDAGLPSLWKYQSTASIDSNLKPSSVIRVTNSQVENFNKANLDFSVKTNMEEYRKIRAVNDRNARVKSITISKGSFIAGIRTTLISNGAELTTTIGTMGINEETYNFEHNEVITGIKEVQCVKWSDQRYNRYVLCAQNQFEIKTALVTEDGGFLQDKGTWAPYGSTATEWMGAPTAATFHNDTFVPHVIGFGGQWTGDSLNNVESRVPFWLYETME